MTRREGLLCVGGVWAMLAAWTALLIWPFWASVGWLLGCATLMVYAALFVWPNQGDDAVEAPTAPAAVAGAPSGGSSSGGSSTPRAET